MPTEQEIAAAKALLEQEGFAVKEGQGWYEHKYVLSFKVRKGSVNTNKLVRQYITDALQEALDATTMKESIGLSVNVVGRVHVKKFSWMHEQMLKDEKETAHE